jgi:hypothetical protein
MREVARGQCCDTFQPLMPGPHGASRSHLMRTECRHDIRRSVDVARPERRTP